MADAEPWADVLKRISEQNEKAVAACCAIEEWAWETIVGHDVLPRRLPETLNEHLLSLRQYLSEQEGDVDAVFQRLCSQPTLKMVAGHRLTREEYYLLKAMGIDLLLMLGVLQSPMGDDFEVLENLWYEDDKRVCFINVAAEGEKKMNVGKPPEKLRLRFLREAQREFLDRNLPELITRFMQD